VKLQQLIEQYITFRQALGERFRTNAAYLRSFARSLGTQADVTEVRAEQVNTFLAGTGPITSGWFVRHNALLGFYRYAQSRGYVCCVPLPAVLPVRPVPFVPYIFSHEELRRLVDAAAAHRERRGCLESDTLRTLVLLLYGTGLRVGEAVRLDCQDVDLDNSLLTVRQSKFYKSRLVPFGPQLKAVLTGYGGRHAAAVGAAGEPAPFLTTRWLRRVNLHTLQACFRRLCDKAGIRRNDGASYQPRLHDLRHTFAVDRLTSWYRQGACVQKLLPVLSVYLGHAHLAATAVYLSMTPALLAEAGARFERYAQQEVSRG
jgi:integrase/recombinase XerD